MTGVQETMNDATFLESVLRRDRTVVLVALGVIAALAWGYLVYMASAPHGASGVAAVEATSANSPAREDGMASASVMPSMVVMPMTHAWTPVAAFGVFLMWEVMMVAMMLPTVSTMLLAFATINRRRREREEPYVATAIFLCGYLLVWVGFSALAALAQWGLQSAALLSPMLVSTSPILGGVLLIAAGLFQWTPLKNVCLAHCRSPMGFILSDWREGRRGAVLMGLHHGAYCLGCCWVLMGLLFVAGVMNLLWVAAIAIFIILEKLAPRGDVVGRVIGGLLVAGGLALLVQA